MQNALGMNGPDGDLKDLMKKLGLDKLFSLEELLKKKGAGGAGKSGGGGGGGGPKQVAQRPRAQAPQGAQGGLGPATKKFLQQLAQALGPEGVQALAQQNPAIGQAMAEAGVNVGGGGMSGGGGGGGSAGLA